MTGQYTNSFAARRQPDRRDDRHVIAMIGIVIAIGAVASWSPRVYGQVERPSDVFSTNLADPSVPLPQLPRVEHAVVVGETVFICWPKSLVRQATLTAVDLKTGDVKWRHQFGRQDVKVLRACGDQIYCGAEVPRVQIPADLPPDDRQSSSIDDPFEDIHDYLFHVETGKLTTFQRRSPKSFIYWRTPVVDGEFLVSDLVVNASDLKIYELEFESYNSLIDEGKFYATFSERVRKPETKPAPTDENKSDESSVHAGMRSIVATNEDTYIPFIRRMDLKTGVTEVIANISQLSDGGHARWTLVAARGDRVYLQQDALPYGLRDNEFDVVCFDLVAEQAVWKTVVPRELRNVRFRDANTLQDHPQTRLDSSSDLHNGVYHRQPILIDANTGRWQPDPDWRDPFSLMHWHTNMDSIVQVMKNDRCIVVLRRDAALICIDPITGQRLWRGEAAGPWPAFAEILTDQLVLPCLGGIDIYDVMSGQSHRLLPEDVGLRTDPSLRLPKKLSVERDPTLTDARSDRFYDRQLMLLPAIPLVVWVCFRLFVWIRRGRSKTAASS